MSDDTFSWGDYGKRLKTAVEKKPDATSLLLRLEMLERRVAELERKEREPTAWHPDAFNERYK